jgi:hypothetical protein
LRAQRRSNLNGQGREILIGSERLDALTQAHGVDVKDLGALSSRTSRTWWV